MCSGAELCGAVAMLSRSPQADGWWVDVTFPADPLSTANALLGALVGAIACCLSRNPLPRLPPSLTIPLIPFGPVQSRLNPNEHPVGAGERGWKGVGIGMLRRRRPL